MFKFYFDEEGKIFDILNNTKKKRYEFSVTSDEKGAFLNWIKILSSPEFMMDVDLKDIYIKEYINSLDEKRVLFRVKASGKKEDVDRWWENLKRIGKFLDGEYGITHIKRSESNAD